MNFIKKLARAYLNLETQQQQKQPEVQVIPYYGRGMAKDDEPIRNRPATSTPHRAVGRRDQVTADQMETIHSMRIRTALYQMGAWLALARAFNLFPAMQARYISEKQKEAFNKAANEFHQWNSRLVSLGESFDIQETISKLIMRPAKALTDYQVNMLAEIRGVNPADIITDHQAKALAKAKRLDALAESFEVTLAGFTDGDEGNPSMPGDTVYKKSVDVLIWLTGWDNPDWAEIDIARNDLKMIDRMAARAIENAEQKGEGSRELDDALINSNEMSQGSNSGKE